MTPLTLLISLTNFKSSEDTNVAEVTKITPDAVTRLAFDKDNDYKDVYISNETGPVNDGKVDIIDAIYLPADEIDATDIDRALVVRLGITELTYEAIQAIGTALESYMDRNGSSQFATAAIHDIGQNQEMFGRWNTVLFTRNHDGKWSAKNRGFTSVAKTSNGDYGVLLDGQMTKTDGRSLVSVMLDDTKLDELLNNGYKLQSKKAHLVRPPIDQTFAVVSGGKQTVLDDDYHTLGFEYDFTTIQAIDVDGSPKVGMVNTVSGFGNNWDVRTNIPASKAGGLAQAYGAAV